MSEKYYKIPENPNYKTEIREIQDTDPVRAETVVNPLVEDVLENIHAVKKTSDRQGAKLDGIAENANNYTHPNSGATAGTYRSVTVNTQGHVTTGSNPTTTVAQGGTGATDSAGARTNLGVPPTSHASSAATYGVSSAANYGHAMASSASPAAAGTATAGTDNGKYAREGHVHPAQTTVTGNAGTATKLQTARTISLTGDTMGSASFDGSANVNIGNTLANSGVTAGSYGPTTAASPGVGGSFNVPQITVDAKGRATSAANRSITLPTSANTLTTSRTIALTGDVTGSVGFNGSANVNIANTLANSGVTAGSYGPSGAASPGAGNSFNVPQVTVDTKGRVTAANNRVITMPTAYSHPNSGVTAGTYRSVTVNAGGHVTAGSNPTVTVAQGGTGATTAIQALANLGAVSKTDMSNHEQTGHIKECSPTSAYIYDYTYTHNNLGMAANDLALFACIGNADYERYGTVPFSALFLCSVENSKLSYCYVLSEYYDDFVSPGIRIYGHTAGQIEIRLDAIDRGIYSSSMKLYRIIKM